MSFKDEILAHYSDADRQAGWEQTAVRHALSVVGLPKAALDAAGPKVTFADFRRAFPRFPVFLAAAKLKHPDDLVRALLDFDVTGTRRVYRFMRSPFWKEYEAVRELADSTRAAHAGVVFYHPAHQSLVLHDRPTEAADADGVRVLVKKAGARPVCLEPLRQLAHALATTGAWDPGRPE